MQATYGMFDPLTDLDGMWTVDLAARHLPIAGVPLAKYECWDGRLFLTPHGGVARSHGSAALGSAMMDSARSRGLYLCGSLTLVLGQPDRWIQPDITVLDGPVRGTWVPSEHAVLVAEFVSPESRRRDRIDKPAKCAAAGIPWYLTVDLDEDRERASVELFELKDGAYRSVRIAHAGQTFEINSPFDARFDPAELLMR
ncbi:Uma2 family endonuclease [Catellatospora sp. KI3]|uniref:Uma2 family endonuclease n=1 Tax=Catellatospora sp. KI3 TaxID=3041620 RepID=UPI00248309FF|nr:Uma2 family endonuclease [Catellatospora sp. KI3]MDI1459650.1 Uma2 family endonuclease [Catellatospora sp. KI3]